jgi:hypothetical protein
VGGKEIFTALEITIIIIKIAGTKGEEETGIGLDSLVPVMNLLLVFRHLMIPLGLRFI